MIDFKTIVVMASSVLTISLLSKASRSRSRALAEFYKATEQSHLKKDEYSSLKQNAAAFRVMDQYAQKDPEWAISRYPEQYQKGREIAFIHDDVAKYLRALIQEGEQIVIHGRDGEIMYRVLERTPGVDMSKVHYAITSRPLGAFKREGDSPKLQSVSDPIKGRSQRYEEYLSENYKRYLDKNIPRNSIHVDTGIAGRIPKWLDRNGFQVKAIKMIATDQPDKEIPLSIEPEERGLPSRHKSHEERQRLVDDYLETEMQRLALDKQSGVLSYSPDAPGFWAKLYGILDEMRLPRIAPTRFERRKTLHGKVERS